MKTIITSGKYRPRRITYMKNGKPHNLGLSLGTEFILQRVMLSDTIHFVASYLADYPANYTDPKQHEECCEVCGLNYQRVKHMYKNHIFYIGFPYWLILDTLLQLLSTEQTKP